MYMDDLATEFLRLFVIRADVYAEQQLDKRYLQIKQPLTLEIVQDHLAGNRTIGTYLLNRENQVKVGVFDLDPRIGDPLGVLRRITATCLEKGLQRHAILPEASRWPDPSYHLWVLCSNPTPAKVIRWLIRKILEATNLDSETIRAVELFPKQSELTETQPYGNLVKLPLGFHRYAKKWSRLLSLDTFDPISPNILCEMYGLSFTEKDVSRVAREKTSWAVQAPLALPARFKPLPDEEEERAAQFLAKYWKKGYRNELEMCFLGLCLKRGVSFESARNIIQQVCTLTLTSRDDEKKALDKVDYHYEKRRNVYLKSFRGIRDVIKELKERNESL